MLLISFGRDSLSKKGRCASAHYNAFSRNFVLYHSYVCVCVVDVCRCILSLAIASPTPLNSSLAMWNSDYTCEVSSLMWLIAIFDASMDSAMKLV